MLTEDLCWYEGVVYSVWKRCRWWVVCRDECEKRELVGFDRYCLELVFVGVLLSLPYISQEQFRDTLANLRASSTPSQTL